MSLKIIYYNGFWYSAHLPIGESYFKLLVDQNEFVSKIKKDIRLLCLLFDQIHIPRSHLVTFFNESHYNIVNEYVNSYDFKYLTDRKIIISSRLPYLDNYSDTERLIERVFKKRWNQGLGKSYLNIIKKLESAKIHSGKESKNNIDHFGQYIEIVKDRNKKIAYILKEIKNKSTYSDIPFLHEIFIEELIKSDDLSIQEKVSIWKETNSLYMITGGLDLGDNRRITYNTTIESDEQKHDNSGLLRKLYSPEFIESMIIEEMGLQYLVKYIENDIRFVIHYRNNNKEIFQLWNGFRKQLHEIFSGITLLEKHDSRFKTLSDREIINYYKNYLLKTDDKLISDIVADLVSNLGSEVDPLLGKTVKSGQRFIATKLTKWWSKRELSKSIGEYQKFWSEFKKVLENPSYI